MTDRGTKLELHAVTMEMLTLVGDIANGVMAREESYQQRARDLLAKMSDFNTTKVLDSFQDCYGGPRKIYRKNTDD